MPKGYSVNPHKDKRGLTPQQAIFVDNALVVGPKEAAAMAYPNASEKSQGEIAAQNMVNDEVVLSLGKEAEKLGLKKKNCIETIIDGLKATKLYGQGAIEHPDFAARIKAAELGLKIHGELKDTTNVAVGLFSDGSFRGLIDAYYSRTDRT